MVLYGLKKELLAHSVVNDASEVICCCYNIYIQTVQDCSQNLPNISRAFAVFNETVSCKHYSLRGSFDNDLCNTLIKLELNRKLRKNDIRFTYDLHAYVA